ncbi:MAG: methyl-accepting chemotaxis protein [Desulfobulbaceae bacterium]|nr:methyl-accepting chemotaxis protein [Desulfobulbaceae bacterium]
MSINFKLKLIVFSFAAIILIMFLATLFVTNKQKNDGLVINLAGRQRMLSQQMIKELYEFRWISRENGQSDPESASRVRNTMEVFEITLGALKDSGKAPLSPNLKEAEYVFLPAAQGDALLQLEKVDGIWRSFSLLIEEMLRGTAGAAEEQAIAKNNLTLLGEMNSAVVILQKDAERSVRLLLILQVLFLFIGGVFTAFAVISIRSITRRLQRADAFAEVFGSGDLRAVSGITGEDELGKIGSSLDAMAKHLREMMVKISGNAVLVDSNSGNLLEIAGNLSAGSADVSSRSESVATAAEEMSSNMNSVAAAVEETSTNVSIMAKAVSELVGTIGKISSDTETARKITENAVNQSQRASERINELGGAASEIGKVTESITDISSQTNLLALNATIEAARAGEAGKGFAVVANEIKELAKQTADATDDIRKKVDAIQSSTSATVSEMSAITDVVNQVNDIVKNIASELEGQSVTTKEIESNITQASEAVREVTENVSQSSAVAGEVAGDIAEVNMESKAIIGSSEELAKSARELNVLAGELTSLMKQFTV